MKSKIVKHSVIIHGHKSSVSLEDTFWADLRKIARVQGCALSELIAEIDRGRQGGNLSSAIRVLVLQHLRARAHSQGESARVADGEGSPV
jgi:predicted DNA-binding ribbon-helix-helix protein